MASRLPLRTSTAFAALLLAATLACRGGSCVRAIAESTEAVSGPWWVTSEHAPVETDINGDGVPDFIGLCTDPGEGAPLSVCAFDGASFELLWRTGAIGDTGTAYMVRIGTAASRVVVIDARAVAHTLKLKDGTETAKATMSDRAKVICAPREVPGKLWVALQDRQEGFLDPATLTHSNAARPTSCPDEGSDMPDTCAAMPAQARALMTECAGRVAPPDVPGFIALKVAVEEGDGIAAGMKSPGSAVPMLVGFTPGTVGRPPTLRWQRGFAPGSPLEAQMTAVPSVKLAGGRAVVTYDDLAGEHHLAAIQAATGKTLWDVTSESFFRVGTTAKRVYVSRWSRLDVRDAATGALLGGVGTR
jgi:hypothetical protein